MQLTLATSRRWAPFDTDAALQLFAFGVKQVKARGVWLWFHVSQAPQIFPAFFQSPSLRSLHSLALYLASKPADFYLFFLFTGFSPRVNGEMSNFRVPSKFLIIFSVFSY